MPDLFIHPQGSLPDALRRELEATVAQALAAAMPCPLEYVIPHTVLEMGDAPLPERTVTAHITTNFLYDKKDNAKREASRRIKAAVEDAISRVLGTKAEAFVIESVPAAKD